MRSTTLDVQSSLAQPPAGGILGLLRRWWGLGVVWSILAVCFVLIPPWTHAHSLNDSFAYIQSTQRLAETGTLQLNEQMTTSFVAQAYWGALFIKLCGDSLVSLVLSTVVAAFIAVAGAYCLARVAGVGQVGSVLAGATLAVNPLFFNLSYSFMTEVPFLALFIWAGVCFVVGCREGDKQDSHQARRILVLFFVGGVLAACAYLVRQIGVVAPVAALAALWFKRRLSWRDALAILIMPACAIVGYGLWHGSHIGWADREMGVDALIRWYGQPGTVLFTAAFRILSFLQYCALFCAPIWVLPFTKWLFSRPRIIRPTKGQFAWFVFVGAHFLLLLSLGYPFPSSLFGSVLTSSGAYGPAIDGEWPNSLTLSPILAFSLGAVGALASAWLGLKLYRYARLIFRAGYDRLRRGITPTVAIEEIYLFFLLYPHYSSHTVILAMF